MILFLFNDVPESFLLSQSHEHFESESSKKFSSRVTSSHWFASPNHMKFHIFPMTFLCYEMCQTCYKMAPNNIENGAQSCFNKFDCTLFISKFSQFAFYLSLSLSVISKIRPNFVVSVATSQLVLY